MAYYRSPVLVAEPYEESQGPESPTETSPEELQAFYHDMERRETIERKLSKQKSNSRTSIWSRKSLKRSTTVPPIHPTPSDLPGDSSNVDPQDKNAYDEDAHAKAQEQANSVPLLTSSRCVIVDMKESPPCPDNDAWAAVPVPSVKVKYKLHNAPGPRWYRNHHLIPPSQIRPSMRPPTFFSPSFPPMGASSIPDSDDAGVTSRNTSHSPLPTPASSQTRVGDSGKPRSRKTSQTTPDTVDLLDVTDPWGTNWHHQSPYDFGQMTTAPVDTHDIPNRTRRASMTAMQGRHKSATPSPLSQSTSAVHLHPPQPEIHVPRKLSKRRTPTAENIFPSQAGDVDCKAESVPVTPVDRMHVTPSPEIASSNSNSLPKRMSVAPPPGQHMVPQSQTLKKEKRGSVLGRLVKKFSILKKSTGSDGWHDVPSQESGGYLYSNDSPLDRGRTSPEKPHLDSVKRIPPPSVEQPPEPPKAVEPTPNHDRASISSLDTPYSMGRLTIANPDLPVTEKETPNASEAPLPPEKTQEMVHTRTSEGDKDEFSPVHTPPQQPQPAPVQLALSETRSRFDKPLPPPQLDTPEFSLLAFSDIQTPQVAEQLLPPSSSRNLAPEGSNTQSLTVPNQISPETPKRPSSQPQTNPTSNLNGRTPADSTPNDCSLTRSPSVQTQVVHEPPKRSSPEQKIASSPIKEASTSFDALHVDRSRMQSPPVQARPQQEAPRRTASQQQQASSSSRGVTLSPDTTLTSRNSTQERVSTVHASASHQTRDRAPEASSSHQNTRKTRTHSQQELLSAPAPVQVPFPSAQYAVPFPAQGNNSNGGYYMPSYEDSPLSTSSMLANPPTPYDYRLSIHGSVDQTPPSLPPKNIYEEIRPQEQYPTITSPSRQTETFKLVRSSSGNVYASSQTISAAGQQWEVVEYVEGRKEKSSGSKDQERRSKERELEREREREQQRDREREKDRGKERERRSKDYEHRSKDEQKSKDYEHRSRDYEPRSKEPEYRSKDHEGRSKDSERKSSDYRPKDHEHSSRREHERGRESRKESKAKADVENGDYYNSSYRSSKQARHYQEESSKRSSTKPSSRHQEERSRNDEYKNSRKREEHRERRSERRSADTPSSSAHHTRPQVVPIQLPAPPDPPAPARLERNPSITARPTSEMPSAADMNAMRAKEAWDMERLWKARSMYGLEPNAPTNDHIRGPASTSSGSDDAATHSAVYGSSHTAYVVQTPFHDQGAQIYHSMPTAPPPIIYSSPASIPSIPDSLSSYDPYEHVYRPYTTTSPADYRALSSMPRPSLNNPLPEPPRESPYEPAPLTSGRPSKKHSNEYWKYNGITTAH